MSQSSREINVTPVEPKHYVPYEPDPQQSLDDITAAKAAEKHDAKKDHDAEDYAQWLEDTAADCAAERAYEKLRAEKTIIGTQSSREHRAEF